MFARRDYWFELPPAQIAQRPEPRRDGARLLHLGADGRPADRRFAELVDLLPPAAVVVVNDTRVIPARVHATRPTGGAVELLFVEPDPEHGAAAWRCLARARRPLRAGQELIAGPHRLAIRAGRGADRDDTAITVDAPADVLGFLAAHGAVPLPPYIERAGGEADDDRERYQTVYARAPGAIAAPTAGLHFTTAILDELMARGHTVARVTLHVGLGTFAPVRADDVREHRMHRERYEIPAETAALVASGRPVVAIGTTVVRTLEAAATSDRTVTAGPGETRMFIHPGAGHRFRVVDHLVTNFHLPESTLLMLVCAFAGTAPVLAAYRHAVAAGYRFFSYGDAMLLHRAPA